MTARLLILATALLFSTGGAAIKACDLSSWQVAGFRSGIAAPTIFLLLASARRRWNRPVLAVGAAYALTLILFVHANKLTTAANAIFLQATAPLYILLLGPWMLREPIRRQDLVLVVLLATGLAAFFFGFEPPVETAPRPLLGNLVAVGAGLGWALTLIGLRWLGQLEPLGDGSLGLAPAAVVCGNVLAGVACLPAALPVVGATVTDGLIVGYLGVFQIGLAYFILMAAIGRVRALEASMLLLLEPVAGAIWSWLVHDEMPGPWSWFGGSLILLATVGYSWFGSRSESRLRAARNRPRP